MLVGIAVYAGAGLVLLVGHMTCAVLTSRARARRADELADRWYRERAEWRLRALGDEQRRYAEAVTALVAEDAVREAEAILTEAR